MEGKERLMLLWPSTVADVEKLRKQETGGGASLDWLIENLSRVALTSATIDFWEMQLSPHSSILKLHISVGLLALFVR